MIKILDCTLRDGGYINNWEFGKEKIITTIDGLEKTGVDIIEIGFLKNEKFDENRTVYNDIRQVSKLISQENDDIKYAVMCETSNPIALEKIPQREEGMVDIIRIMVWKTRHDEKGNIQDALQEGYEYCKGLKEKGYEICIQPARVEQYTDQEFIDMIHLFQQLEPLAIYVVDSWGTQQSSDILHYVKLADQNMKPNIAIGYHGHNNMMQVFNNTIDFINYELEVERDLYLDASIYGIGRGAGNLNLELIANYLNTNYSTRISIEPMYKIFSDVINPIFNINSWGYSMAYFLTAQYHCNPNYGIFYEKEMNLKLEQIDKILDNISEDDKVIFSKSKAKKYAEQYLMFMNE